MAQLGTCFLRDLASIGLGFKSLQNKFFYLPQDTIDHYSIEEQFLRPIFTMKDLDGDSYFQSANAAQWLFYCKEREADLSGTGALKYIRAMENRPATESKQGGDPQSIKDALCAQGAGQWYSPKAIMHESHIWLRKAFNTSFNPFLFTTAVVVDQRCNYLLPKNLKWEVLAAVLTSSVFALSAESHGASSMGAGALELATKQLPEVRTIDVRTLSSSETKELIKLAQMVWKSEKANDWSASEPGPHMQELDGWMLSKMGKLNFQSKIYTDLIGTCHRRVKVAKDKGTKTRRATGADVTTVAKGIADSIRPFLESKQFPEGFLTTGTQVTSFDLPKLIDVEVHPLMHEAVLLISSTQGKLLMERQLAQPVAQVIVKALMLGRRQFVSPTSEDGAIRLLEKFAPWIDDIQHRINEGCRLSSVGTKYEEQVRTSVFKELGIDSRVSTADFFGLSHLR